MHKAVTQFRYWLTERPVAARTPSSKSGRCRGRYSVKQFEPAPDRDAEMRREVSFLHPFVQAPPPPPPPHRPPPPPSTCRHRLAWPTGRQRSRPPRRNVRDTLPT